MSTDSVLLEISNGVGKIILNEPKSLKALSSNMVRELKEAIQEVKEKDYRWFL